jgi:hypothetical protein
MSIPGIYRLRYGHKRIIGDTILPLVPGALLMLNKNIDSALGKSFLFSLPFSRANRFLGLVNGVIVKFYGFGETQATGNYITASSRTYMLVKLFHDPGVIISLPGLPESYLSKSLNLLITNRMVAKIHSSNFLLPLRM